MAASRSRIAEQDVVFGGLRRSLGVEAVQGEGGVGEVRATEVLYSHLAAHLGERREVAVEEWGELAMDLQGFPFNNLVVNRTNVASCLLHYIRSSASLQLAARSATNLFTNHHHYHLLWDSPYLGMKIV